MKIMTNKKIKLSFSIFIIFLVSTMSISSVWAERVEIKLYDYGEVETDISRLYFANDYQEDSGIRHFTYLKGDDVDLEPRGLPYTANHIFKYGQIDNNTQSILFIENVTNMLVYPYHYNFVIDSIGQVHTTFITNNYTLYYGLRDISGKWVIEALTQPDIWFSWAPTIALNSNDEPRIVHVVSYQENADEFWGNPTKVLQSIRSVHYLVYDDNEWKTFDVGDNHGLFPLEPSRFLPFNPGLKIENNRAYIVYNNNVQLAAESRLQYLTIPEIPTQQSGFRSITHQFIAIATGIATIFSRPVIELIGETGIVVAAGTFRTGGSFISYKFDRYEQAESSRSANRVQWQTESVSQEIGSRPTWSISIAKTGENSIIIGYSVFDMFDTARLRFTEHVFYKRFTFVLDPEFLEDGELKEGMRGGITTRLTNIQNIRQSYVNIIAINNTIELAYFRFSSTLTPKLLVNSFSDPIFPTDNAPTAFILIGIVSVSFTVLGILSIRLLPKKQKEVEILPHMINLKEAISND
jgi:hypothetical protein